MVRQACCFLLLPAALVLISSSAPSGAQTASTSNAIEPAKMPLLGSVDARFQSYNIEMVEVTGGRFWAPYKQQTTGPTAVADTKVATPGGIDPSLFRMRSPIDLDNPRLRKLAAALGPAYVRVSGTWANTTYFHDSDAAAPATPPSGFNGVLTRKEWKGVIDFSKAVNARIVTSFAVSAGVRDPGGVWSPVEAEKVLAFTRKAGGSIAAAELFNEPNFAAAGGTSKDYDAAAYGRDFNAFKAFVAKAAPEMKILGPGSVGEGGSMAVIPGMRFMRSEDMLAASGEGLDAFSYHFYGGVSQRCKAMGAVNQATPEGALKADWLLRTNRDETFYAALRDRFAPGKPLWLTETGETACGGNPWASTFLDSFRYLNQLGTLAKKGVQVVMHNTLAASDYALIDEVTLAPRPNYWSAFLWRKLMGTKVLDAGTPGSPDLYLYAHCLRDHPGGVALLAINADRGEASVLALPIGSSRYALTSAELTSGEIELNGAALRLDADGDLPVIAGVATAAGKVSLAPTSITFFALPKANNPSCR